jgi:hypothetical protein
LKSFIGAKQKGYLYSKGEDYFEFSAFPNCKYEQFETKEMESFDAAVQEYFLKYKKTAHQEEEVF